ncbi:hypothetical protein H310_14087 [Aphanomyces invadans]|uniref:Uncharacterized protein n=1 Tax=Aphanomyces invadans TaxID=157072 RepID=A0A024TAN8_9STRA|nr:hypothetical protein H310_14087 [Aphanomyces invadans]ETV91210.1 hypothetical protein H310_14087 [Aphanomyces invadans]|eukprot:XP_008880047.1 hypothetical protein H310_14087 [Aphanomyces invadans]
MLHNVDTIFHEYGLPCRDSTVSMEYLDIALEETCWNLENRLHQAITSPNHAEIAKPSEFHRHSACDRLGVDAVPPVPSDVIRAVTSQNLTLLVDTCRIVGDNGAAPNAHVARRMCLCGEFIEPDCAIFVIQQIRDDGARPTTATDRMRD